MLGQVYEVFPEEEGLCLRHCGDAIYFGTGGQIRRSYLPTKTARKVLRGKNAEPRRAGDTSGLAFPEQCCSSQLLGSVEMSEDSPWQLVLDTIKGPLKARS